MTGLNVKIRQKLLNRRNQQKRSLKNRLHAIPLNCIALLVLVSNFEFDSSFEFRASNLLLLYITTH